MDCLIFGPRSHFNCVFKELDTNVGNGETPCIVTNGFSVSIDVYSSVFRLSCDGFDGDFRALNDACVIDIFLRIAMDEKGVITLITLYWLGRFPSPS